MMLSALRQRFSPECARRYRYFIVTSLIFSLCLALVAPARRALAQDDCRIEYAANVPTKAQKGDPVNFTATITGGDCVIAPAYEWDFGDGTARANRLEMAHAYEQAGAYQWKFTTSLSRIDTVAGGYGEGAPAKQAPFTTPVAIVRDPLGRGLYIADQTTFFGAYIRFINTSNAAVIVAGKTIAPGAVRHTAGGGTVTQAEDMPALAASFNAVGLAVSADGQLLFISEWK